MKQVLRKGLKDIVVEEVADPVASAHHVLVRPLYSLISSGTETADLHTEGVLKEVADNPSHLRKVWDVMKVAGPLKTANEVRAKFEEYAALGYSGAGVVVDKHPTVTDLEVGDRVAYGGEGTGHGETVLAGRNLVVKVPAEVPFEHACFTTLGSIAMNSVRIAQIGLGETVVVVGLGLVGQLVAQLARLQGGVVMAIDLKPERVELARAAGADYALVGGASVVSEVAALTGGRGADVVIVAAASKSPAPAQQAIRLCRDRGRLVIVGAVPLELSRDEMYAKELQLLMSRAYGPGSYDPAYEKRGQDYPLPYVRWTENRNMEEFLRLAARGQLHLGQLISYRFALGSLTVRDEQATNIGETFDWDRPDFDVPDLPDPEHVASRPCSLGGGDVLEEQSAQAHMLDLVALEELVDLRLQLVELPDRILGVAVLEALDRLVEVLLDVPFGLVRDPTAGDPVVDHRDERSQRIVEGIEGRRLRRGARRR